MTIASRRRFQLALLLGPVSAFLAVFFLGPLAIMIVTSFLAPGLYGGVEWTFYPHNFGRILGFADPMFEEFDPIYIAIFLRSIEIAALTVLATLLVCYPAAFCIARLSDRWKNFCLFLITLPFFTSLIVRLFVWVLILRQTGLVNEVLLSTGLIERPLDLIYTKGAIILGMTYVFIPFMFMPVYASVEKLDWTLVRASLDLGAGPVRTFLRIILPLTARHCRRRRHRLHPGARQLRRAGGAWWRQGDDVRQPHRAAVPRRPQLALRCCTGDDGDERHADHDDRPCHPFRTARRCRRTGTVRRP